MRQAQDKAMQVIKTNAQKVLPSDQDDSEEMKEMRKALEMVGCYLCRVRVGIYTLSCCGHQVRLCQECSPTQIQNRKTSKYCPNPGCRIDLPKTRMHQMIVSGGAKIK